MKRFGMEPDVFAAHAYDGMNMIVEAIQKVGLNRVLIRDILTGSEDFSGLPGCHGRAHYGCLLE